MTQRSRIDKRHARASRYFSFFWGLVTFAIAISARVARADGPLPPSLPGVGVTPHVGAAVPTDIRLRDVDGNTVTTGDLFASGRPVVLVLAYSSCPMLCNLVLRGIADAAHDARQRPDNDFDLVTVSIDPAESPQMAGQSQARLSTTASKQGESVRWRYLLGDQANIARLADTLGFNYRLDPTTHQYAHPAVVFVLSPHGTITQYLYGLRQPAGALDAAVTGARTERLTPASAFEAVLSCFRFDPTKRKYGALIVLALRIGGGLIVMTALGSAFWLYRRRSIA